jgi:hypothetical protein
VPDIAIDYELLHHLGQTTDTLKNKLDDARRSSHVYAASEVGEAEFAIAMFYDAWKSAFKNAGTLLESLSQTYTGVAQQWFEQDAQYAATANEQAAGFTHSMWEMQKSAYDNWQKLSHTYETVHGFDKNGNPYEKQVPLADPNNPPPAPGAEPHGYQYIGPDGSLQNTTTTYDANGNVKSSDTTVTDGNGGFGYHEHTEFGDNGGYVSTVNHTDGTTTVESVTGNSDGTGTKTDVYTDANGKTTTTTYTGTGVNGPNPTWTQTTSTQTTSGNASDNRPGDNNPFYK